MIRRKKNFDNIIKKAKLKTKNRLEAKVNPTLMDLEKIAILNKL